MIFSEEQIERFYAGGVTFGLFDHRRLLPVSQLAYAVEAETGHRVSESDLQHFVADGWYSSLPLQLDSSNCGVPLFVPSRIGLLLDLSIRGYSAKELSSFAAWEDFWIGSFGELDLDYEDDDLQLLLRHHRDRLTSEEGMLQFSTGGEPSALEQAKRDLEKIKAQVSSLERLQGQTLSPDLREQIKRAAFSVRAVDESIRLQFVEEDRAKFIAGYSPFVLFRRHGWSAKGGHSFEQIEWHATLSTPWIEEWAQGVRTPEFILDGDMMTILRPLIPSAYKKAWDERGLGDYFEALADVRGETRCLHCRSVLPGERNPRQRYCSDACRAAAKQRRLRENNPDSIFKAQSNYYQSLAPDHEKKNR